jgi:hypothetical protein
MPTWLRPTQVILWLAATASELENVPEGKPEAGKPKSDVNLALTVAAPVFFGLFFVEYLPLFAVGYWTWTGTVHKILSGAFLLLNLALAEYAVRRSRSRARRWSHPPGPPNPGKPP